MAIIERDAVSFDVLLLEFARPESDPELIEAGRRVFGGRTITSTPSSVLPAAETAPQAGRLPDEARAD